MGEIFRSIRRRAALLSRRLVYTEAEDARVVSAAVRVESTGLAHAILVGDPDRVLRCSRRNGVSLSGVEIQPIDPAKVAQYVEATLPEWRAKGLGEAELRVRMQDPVEFSAAMVRHGDADGILMGPGRASPASFARGQRLFRYFVAEIEEGQKDRCLTFASPLTGPRPTPVELAEAALGAAGQFHRLTTRDPSVAFLSLGVTATLEAPQRFNTVQEMLVESVGEAIRTVQARDAVLNVSRELYEQIPRSGSPDVFVFASERGASSHGLRQALPKTTRVVGPLIGGLAQPMNSLSSSYEIDDIVDISAVTCLG